MADWVLIPCLKALFAEFDRIAPSRDHASDGSVGDAAHQNEVSDHNPDESGNVPIHDADHVNEVHAIDVDNNLNSPDLGSDPMEKVVQFLLGRCRSGAEKRLRYMIYNRRIWSASSGWVQKTYTGASPHTEHAHFSASYETNLEASTVSWGLVEEFGDDMLPIKQGTQSEDVKHIQYLLKELGYDPGSVDGIYGDATAAAVNALRAAHNTGPDSAVSGWTYTMMQADLARMYAGKPGKDGAPGKDGEPGQDGRDGVVSGTLTVTDATIVPVP